MRVLIPIAAGILLLVITATAQFQHATHGQQIGVVAVVAGVALAFEVAAGRRARRAPARPSYSPYGRR